jgi:hypothetical protein
MQGRDVYPIFLEFFFCDSFDNNSKELAKFSTAYDLALWSSRWDLSASSTLAKLKISVNG